MTIEIINGDLLDALANNEIAWAVHCVNCQETFGSGLALEVKKRYPDVYKEYVAFSKDVKANWAEPLLGQIQRVPVSRYLELAEVGCDFYEKGVVNVFGQEFYGTHKRQVNYGALGKAFTALSYGLTQAGDGALNDYEPIGFPYKFASCRGGADWDIVLEMIEFHFKNHNVKIYKLE
jgi:hypothetical protein